MFLHDLALVDMLFQTKQYLTRVDGLDEIVGYFLSDGLLHDLLFLGLGDHHHGQGRVHAFDLLQGF